MSLHIESTEDALAELKKQRTKTLTAAISVSFLGVVLMGLLLYLVHIIVAVPEDPPMVAYATQEGDNPDIDTPEVTQTTQRPSSSSTSAQVKVIAAVATADVAVVNPDIEVDVPSEELSMGIDIGDGFGTGTGDGDGGGIPGIISKRCDLNDRMKRITENGGTPQCEEAVVKSLRWLKTQQNGNGSWGEGQFRASMTGISLLAYLAGILPHGIFEIPALVFSIACGVYLCRNMCRMVTNHPGKAPLLAVLEDLLRVMVMIVAPLTVAAAFVECYVTPVIMALFL